jgi:predicted negative regulator of RcsB-dependent stress response
MQNKFSSVGIGLIVGILMGAGGAWGWMTLTAPPPEVPVEATVVKPDRIVKVVDEQALYEAKRQIENLKRQLADAGKPVFDQEPKQPKIVKEGKKDAGEQARDFVKKSLTPEQQAEIAAQRDAFRQQMEQRVNERNDFLASVDTRNMNPAQRENHDKLLASVNRMNELRAAIMDPKAQGAPEMRKEMHDLGHSMDDLYQEERKTLLEATGKNLGYAGDQAQLFAGQIQSIYENTSSGRGMMWASMGGGHHSAAGGNTAGTAKPAK